MNERERDTDLTAILAAIVTAGTDHTVANAVDKAEAILQEVERRHKPKSEAGTANPVRTPRDTMYTPPAPPVPVAEFQPASFENASESNQGEK